MTQKVITIILALLVVGGLAWYVDRTYLKPSASEENPSALDLFKKSPSEQGSRKIRLIYVTSGSAKEIWQVSTDGGEKEVKKIFTDADENEKFLKVSNLATLSHEVFVITSNDTEAFSGKLVSINLSTAKENILQKSLAVPSSWSISSDGKKIAFSRFSNLEENYGYTLYTQEASGANTRELAHHSSEIKNPTWNPENSKIAFSKVSETTSEIDLVDTETAKTEVLATFPGKIIDWISWEDDHLILSVREISSNTHGTIEIIDASGKNQQKITDFDGGRANFIYLKDSWLGYLVAQYSKEPDEQTSGQLYLKDLSSAKIIPLGKGCQILGLEGMG